MLEAMEKGEAHGTSFRGLGNMTDDFQYFGNRRKHETYIGSR